MFDYKIVKITLKIETFEIASPDLAQKRESA